MKTQTKKSRYLLWRVLLISPLVFSACGEKSMLEEIRESGELRFVTVESPLTYFVDEHGNARGAEYELASLFAWSLGIALKVIAVGNEYDVVSLIENHKAHVGSSALTPLNYPAHLLQHGPAYMTARRQLVYYQKDKNPEVRRWIQNRVDMIRVISNQELLDRLSVAFPDLAKRALEDKSIAELLSLVNENSLPVAIADSHWVSIYRHLFPEIGIALDLTDDLPVAWLYRKEDERSLDLAINAFFARLKKSAIWQRILDRYHNDTLSFDYVDVSTFLAHANETLPTLTPLFKEAAEETGIDWQLIAAMSYQESHWDTNAKSPTGVRGLMMLTMDTAELLGVENRLDPRQSILGGARYLAKMLKTIPQRIQGDDRLCFALAAYNIGFGHLEDARKLTQSQGDDPDKWADVSRKLPLLADENWYPETEHGYARGAEPVRYVKNIQRYYAILKWKHSEAEKITRRDRPRHDPLSTINAFAL